jgi:hypothetical protein
MSEALVVQALGAILRELREQSSELNRISREQKLIRELTSKFVNQMIDAEKEIPEFARRFMNYYHDCHDVRYMYENLGQPVPQHVNREIERCDDRYRQLLDRLNSGGEAFEKIRREMASDPSNRWDHTKFLEKPKEKDNGKMETT